MYDALLAGGALLRGQGEVDGGDGVSEWTVRLGSRVVRWATCPHI